MSWIREALRLNVLAVPVRDLNATYRTNHPTNQSPSTRYGKLTLESTDRPRVEYNRDPKFQQNLGVFFDVGRRITLVKDVLF